MPVHKAVKKEPTNYTLADLIIKVKTYLTEDADIELINSAYSVAERAHKSQIRKSGQPFILHPLQVAYILAELNAAPEVIAAGLLHDVVEDTEVTLDDLDKLFGATVRKLVDGVTKLDQLAYNKTKASRSETSNDNYQKLMLAMVKDVRVVIVKLADRLHNMRTIFFLREEKQKQIAQETIDILAPLAHRLGMFKIKSELEDLSFSVLNPDAYNQTLEKIEKNRMDRQESLDGMVEKISYTLRSHNISYTIKGRVKSVYSMYNKIKKNQATFSDIYDLLAIRILTDTITDCYGTLGYIHNVFTPMPKRIKDYIAVPKTNGYQSLHTTVFGVKGNIFEIQIRTYEMDYIAEYGVAAHWAYKEGKSVSNPKQLDKIQSELKIFQDLEEVINLSENNENSANDFIDHVKHDIFDATVFAFTPSGDVYQLSKGATPIDFAYKIHTQVGHRMIGAKVNNRMVPISYEIKLGDIVEILTSQTIKPSESWLRVATSSHAKSKIRAYFKKERREENVAKGKEMLNQMLDQMDYQIEMLFNEEGLDFILERFAFQNIDEMYASIGQNVIGAKTMINRLLDFHHIGNEEIEIEDAHKIETVSQQQKEKLSKKGNNIVEISGSTNVRISLAKCCSPIPGDMLVGYVSKGHGIVVHRLECPQAEKEKERHIDVVWVQDLPTTKYIVPLKVMSFDRKGLLSELLQSLYKINTDIVDIQSKVEPDNMVYTKILLTAQDTDHLAKIFVAIKKVPEVYEVVRMNI
ncbi:MAG: RelA/SpoT family protein [Culicoidibacterales bacterium]